MGLESFGISKDDLDKSKDILPTLELGKFELGTEIFLKVLDKQPLEVEHIAFFEDKEKGIKKGDKIKTPVLKALVVAVHRPQKDNPEALIVPMNEKFTIWLSSKTLSLGFGRVYDNNQNSLENVEVKIKVSTATYKNFGENKNYIVSQIEKTEETEE